MKNKLLDLNNHLFAQLERLGDEDVSGDKLAEEIDRAKAVAGIASQIVANTTLALKAQELMYKYGVNTTEPRKNASTTQTVFH